MARMVRKQVYIEERHDRLLKERAKKYRVTEAELIRRAIDRELAATAPDPAAWEELKRRIERYRKKAPRAHALPWTRDDLHDR
jgi:hypothetical protein